MESTAIQRSLEIQKYKIYKGLKSLKEIRPSREIIGGEQMLKRGGQRGFRGLLVPATEAITYLPLVK